MSFYGRLLKFINLLTIHNCHKVYSWYFFSPYFSVVCRDKGCRWLQQTSDEYSKTKPIWATAVWGLMFLKRLCFFVCCSFFLSSHLSVTSSQKAQRFWLSSSWLTPRLIGRRGRVWTDAPKPLPPLEIDVYTQVNCKQRKKEEEHLIAFRMMFQKDINLMDGEHTECILGHQWRRFEVKSWSVDLVGQTKPSGKINYVLPGTGLSYISEGWTYVCSSLNTSTYD